MTDYDQALKELRKVHEWLVSISDAASSFEEGFEELLTVNKLKLLASLKKLFGSTNMIESCYSVTGELCRNVKCWRGANMAMRWAGAMLVDSHAFTGVALTISGFVCPATPLLETALTPTFTGGELPRN
jgi:transposase-like protein